MPLLTDLVGWVGVTGKWWLFHLSPKDRPHFDDSCNANLNMDFCNQGADCRSFFQFCVSKTTRCHDEAVSLLYVNHLWVGLIVIGFWNQFKWMVFAYKAPHNVVLSFLGEYLVPNYFAQPFKSPSKNLLKVLPPLGNKWLWPGSNFHSSPNIVEYASPCDCLSCPWSWKLLKTFFFKCPLDDFEP